MSLNSWLNARERTATLSVAPCAATAAALRGSACAPNWPCAAEKSAKLRAKTKASFFIQPRPKPTLPEYKEPRRCDSIPSKLRASGYWADFERMTELSENRLFGQVDHKAAGRLTVHWTLSAMSKSDTDLVPVQQDLEGLLQQAISHHQAGNL